MTVMLPTVYPDFFRYKSSFSALKKEITVKVRDERGKSFQDMDVQHLVTKDYG